MGLSPRAGGLKTVDTGTEYRIYDPATGQFLYSMPKNLRAEKREEQIGTGEGRRIADEAAAAPGAIDYSNKTIDMIDEALTHPGFDANFGKAGVIPNRPGSDAANAWARIKQLMGRNFVDAYSSIKGAGPITDAEGAAATAAQSRLDTSTSAEEARSALLEMKQLMRERIAKAQRALAAAGGAGSTDPGVTAPPADIVTVTPGEVVIVEGQRLYMSDEGLVDDQGNLVFDANGEKVSR